MAELNTTPDPTGAEVLSAHGKADTGFFRGDTAESEIKRGADFAKTLREKSRRDSSSGRDFFKDALTIKAESDTYKGENARELSLKFGAGEAKIDTTTKDIIEPVKSDAKEVFLEGKKQLDTISNILDFTSLKQDISKGMKYDDALLKYNLVDEKGVVDPTKFSQMRENAVDGILNMNGFVDAFPFLAKLAPDDAKKFVEETLLSDPALRLKIVDKMKAVQKNADQLPELNDKNRGKRLKQEGALIGDLSQVVRGSVVDVLEDRYDKYVGAKKEEWKNEDDQALVRLGKSLEQNWISYDMDTRTRNVDTKQLGEDIKRLVYHGQEGLNRLVLRDLGLKDENGGVLDWENIDLALLTGPNKEIYDNALKKYGDVYRNKLMTDFGSARATEYYIGMDLGRLGKLGVGTASDLRLKDFELNLLNQKFGDAIEAEVKKSPDANKIYAKLKAEGYDKDNDRKGWLLALLYAMGLLGLGVVEGVKTTVKEGIRSQTGNKEN